MSTRLISIVSLGQLFFLIRFQRSSTKFVYNFDRIAPESSIQQSARCLISKLYWGFSWTLCVGHSRDLWFSLGSLFQNDEFSHCMILYTKSCQMSGNYYFNFKIFLLVGPRTQPVKAPPVQTESPFDKPLNQCPSTEKCGPLHALCKTPQIC